MQELHNAIISGTWERLGVDDVLAVYNVTHSEYRTWLRRNRLPQYATTPGLRKEVCTSSSERTFKELAWEYAMSYYEVRNCVYGYDNSKDVRDNKELLADIKAGTMTQVSLAHKYGITQARVSQIKTELGLSPGNRKRKTYMTPELKAKMRARFDEGASITELMAEFDVSRTATYNAVRKQ